jgi:hypothetical protein
MTSSGAPRSPSRESLERSRVVRSRGGADVLVAPHPPDQKTTRRQKNRGGQSRFVRFNRQEGTMRPAARRHAVAKRPSEAPKRPWATRKRPLATPNRPLATGGRRSPTAPRPQPTGKSPGPTDPRPGLGGSRTGRVAGVAGPTANAPRRVERGRRPVGRRPSVLGPGPRTSARRRRSPGRRPRPNARGPRLKRPARRPTAKRRCHVAQGPRLVREGRRRTPKGRRHDPKVRFEPICARVAVVERAIHERAGERVIRFPRLVPHPLRLCGCHSPSAMPRTPWLRCAPTDSATRLPRRRAARGPPRGGSRVRARQGRASRRADRGRREPHRRKDRPK